MADAAFNRSLPAGGQQEVSRYLDYLPAIYRQPDAAGENFIGRFLLAFEDILSRGYDDAEERVAGLEQLIGFLHAYFHPNTAPLRHEAPENDFLPWLFTWIGLEWDDDLEEAELRRLLKIAVRELYPRRGTREGLRRYLEVVAHAHEVEFLENRWPANMQIGFASTIGENAKLTDEETRERLHCFIAKIKVRWQPLWQRRKSPARQRDRQQPLLLALKRKAAQVLAQERPAHTQCYFSVTVSTMEIGCASTIGFDTFMA